ncbi:MAG TPA: cation transporter [Phycisphaerales bacterium]|nr:cation transporter [Phycisphaerales bacterium]
MTTKSQTAEYTLLIDGMTCGHCVRTVSSTLNKVPSVVVRSVAVGSAEIEAPDGLTVAAAVVALDEAGYPARVRDSKTLTAQQHMTRKSCCTSGGGDNAGQGCCD